MKSCHMWVWYERAKCDSEVVFTPTAGGTTHNKVGDRQWLPDSDPHPSLRTESKPALPSVIGSPLNEQWATADYEVAGPALQTLRAAGDQSRSGLHSEAGQTTRGLTASKLQLCHRGFETGLDGFELGGRKQQESQDWALIKVLLLTTGGCSGFLKSVSLIVLISTVVFWQRASPLLSNKATLDLQKNPKNQWINK